MCSTIIFILWICYTLRNNKILIFEELFLSSFGEQVSSLYIMFTMGNSLIKMKCMNNKKKNMIKETVKFCSLIIITIHTW